MKPSKHVLVMVGLLVGILGVGVGPARAVVTPAIAFDTYTLGSTTAPGLTIGWEFTTDRPLVITHLGYYDYAADGLTVSHDVGIFNLSSTLLVSDTVASGTGELVLGNTAFGSFRYHDITDYYLPAGTYRIGGVGGDTSQNSPFNLTTAAPITLGNAYEVNGAGVLTYPTTFVSGPTDP